MNQPTLGPAARPSIPGIGEKVADDSSANLPVDASGNDCPVTPLGSCDMKYYFATRRGERVSLPFTQMVKPAGLLGLFDGVDEWLQAKFPKLGRAPTDASGDVIGDPPVIGFNAQRAGAHLMAACAALPMFDASMPTRGCGVWRGNAGSVIVHCGSKLLVGDAIGWAAQLPGARLGEAIYHARPAIPVPIFPAASPELAHEVREILGSWNYLHETASHALLGWLGQAMLGALPDWRAHVLVVGGHGSGKSLLFDLISAALGKLGHGFNGFSEAGLRQALSTEARAVLLDEAEGDDDESRHVDKTIGLLRKMSSGAGLKQVLGSVGGQPQGFQVTGSAYLSAINAPDLRPQDQSRFTKIELCELLQGADDTPVREAVARFATLSPALWGRALHQVPTFRANFILIRRLLRDRGCSARQADQPATLLASYYAMVEDAPVPEKMVAYELQHYAWMIRTVADHVDETAPRLCLGHLTSTVVPARSGADRITIGQLLVEAQRAEGDWARQVLIGHGIRIDRSVEGGRAANGYWISNRNPQLLSVFAGTQWARYRWADELKRLDGAKPSTQPVRIGASKTRATWLPVQYLPAPDGEAVDEASGTVEKPP